MDFGLGLWTLDFGLWTLDFGLWNITDVLEFSSTPMDFGLETLHFVLWNITDVLEFSSALMEQRTLDARGVLCHENFHHNIPIGDNVDLQQWQCGEEVKPQSLQDEQVLGVGKKEATPLSHLWSLEFSGVLIYCRPLTGLRLSDSCDSVHLILV